MKKETLIKLFVVVVVLAFVLEIIAVPFLGGGTAPKTSGANAAVTGTVQAEAEIISFDPALIAVGKDSRFAETVKGLQEQKLVTFVTPADENTALVNLASISAMRNVSEALQAINLSVYVTTTLSLPAQIDVITEKGEQVSVAGAEFNAQFVPDFEVGDKLMVSFDAEANYDSSGKPFLAKYGNLKLLPVPKSDLGASAKVIGIRSAIYSLSVPWEQRMVDMGAVDERFGNLSGKPAYKYVQKSYISVANASDAELAALNARKLAYITQITPPDTISISPSFTNRSELMLQLGSSLLAKATFPDSEIMVEYNVTNSTFDDASTRLEIVNAAEGLGATNMSYHERVELELPLNASGMDGKGYIIPKNSSAMLVAEGKHTVNETVEVVFDGAISGNRVMRIGSIKVSE